MTFSMRAAFLAGTLAMLPTGAFAEPITLATALDQANAASPRIAASEARVRAAEALARQAGLAPNPEASIEVENFAGTGPYSGLGGSEVTVGFSQQVERGGKRGARRAVASAQRDMAMLELARTRATLAFDVRTAFAELRAAEDRAILARENAARAEQFVQTATTLVDAGRDPPLRQLRAEALLAEANAESVRSFGALLNARRMLQVLTGIEDNELSALSEDDLASPPEAGQLATLDVRTAEAAVAEARARIDLARADAVPDITASGGVRQFSDGRDAGFIVGLSMPIPIRNRNQGGIEAAQAEALAAESELLMARIDANRSTYDASIALQAADARLAVLAGPNLQQAEEAVRLATIGYNAGRFTLVELLDAQSALTSARQALIDARLDRARALAALARATAQ
jgi:outer membrane protein, heavy metal efflux system